MVPGGRDRVGKNRRDRVVGPVRRAVTTMPVPPLFSERRGDGTPALIFLHGLLASGRYWYPVVDHLAGVGHALYLVDLLGFGRSPWPDLAYTVDDHVAALQAWRVAAGLVGEPLVVVGHSLGALLALEWAARAPAVRGAIAINLPVYRDPRQARRQLAQLSPLHRLTLMSRPLAHAACALMCATRPLARALAPLFAPQFPADVARDGALHTWPSLSGTLERCVFATTFAHVRELAAASPLALLHGGADETAPVQVVRELATGLPRARLLEVAGGGHDLPLSHPEQVGRIIRECAAELSSDDARRRASNPRAALEAGSGGRGR